VFDYIRDKQDTARFSRARHASARVQTQKLGLEGEKRIHEATLENVQRKRVEASRAIAPIVGRIFGKVFRHERGHSQNMRSAYLRFSNTTSQLNKINHEQQY